MVRTFLLLPKMSFGYHYGYQFGYHKYKNNHDQL